MKRIVEFGIKLKSGRRETLPLRPNFSLPQLRHRFGARTPFRRARAVRSQTWCASFAYKTLIAKAGNLLSSPRAGIGTCVAIAIDGGGR
jgi:hypothetical protein